MFCVRVRSFVWLLFLSSQIFFSFLSAQALMSAQEREVLVKIDQIERASELPAAKNGCLFLKTLCSYKTKAADWVRGENKSIVCEVHPFLTEIYNVVWTNSFNPEKIIESLQNLLGAIENNGESMPEFDGQDIENARAIFAVISSAGGLKAVETLDGLDDNFVFTPKVVRHVLNNNGVALQGDRCYKKNQQEEVFWTMRKKVLLTALLVGGGLYFGRNKIRNGLNALGGAGLAASGAAAAVAVGREDVQAGTTSSVLPEINGTARREVVSVVNAIKEATTQERLFETVVPLLNDSNKAYHGHVILLALVRAYDLDTKNHIDKQTLCRVFGAVQKSPRKEVLKSTIITVLEETLNVVIPDMLKNMSIDQICSSLNNFWMAAVVNPALSVPLRNLNTQIVTHEFKAAIRTAIQKITVI